MKSKEEIKEIIDKYMNDSYIGYGVKDLAYMIDGALDGALDNSDIILYKYNEKSKKHYVGISTNFGYIVLTIEWVVSWITNDTTLQITNGIAFYTKEKLYEKGFEDIEDILYDEEEEEE